MVDGQKIKQLREARGLTSQEFAREVYISQTMVSCIENGIKSPSVEVLKRIADYFGCTMDGLLKTQATA